MATGAFGRCAFEDIIDVAFFASYIDVRPGQLEGRKVMVKSGGLPGSGGMAGAANLPEFAFMVVVFLVTGKTNEGRAFEDIINVAFFAGHRDMRPIQFESG